MDSRRRRRSFSHLRAHGAQLDGPRSIAGHNASFVKSFADAYEQINSVAEAIEQTGGERGAPHPLPHVPVHARAPSRSSSRFPTSTFPPLSRLNDSENLGPPRLTSPSVSLPPPRPRAAQDQVGRARRVARGARRPRRATPRVRPRYRCTVGPTDFAGVVRDAEPVPVPDDHAHPARRFSEAVDHARRERTGADATPQDEDGDVVDVTQAAAGGARGHGAVNSKCPLTMKDVFDLEDPDGGRQGVRVRARRHRRVRQATGGSRSARGGAVSRGGDESRGARRRAQAGVGGDSAPRSARRLRDASACGEDEDDEHLLSP